MQLSSASANTSVIDSQRNDAVGCESDAIISYVQGNVFIKPGEDFALKGCKT